MGVNVGVIDYSISNLASVLNSFRHIGVTATTIRDPDRLDDFTHLVLPGVGSFAMGMKNLHKQGMVEPIKYAAEKGTPLLGMCLGMQLFAEEGDEYGPSEGLGLLEGRVVKIETAGTGLRLPHVGWNDVSLQGDSRILAEMGDSPTFYFVHSYCYSDFRADYVAGIAEYSVPLVAVVEKANIIGAQFHPEKSQKDGMQFLKNFLNIHIQDDE